MIDKKSLKILNILQEKARIPNTEVARQVGLAPSAVLERIRKLEQQGIIDGYEVRLNPERFAKNQVAFITLSIDNRKNAHGQIGDQLARLEEVQEVHFIAGDDGYLVKVRVANTSELHRLLATRILTICGVTGSKTATVLQTYKETAKIPIH